MIAPTKDDISRAMRLMESPWLDVRKHGDAVSLLRYVVVAESFLEAVSVTRQEFEDACTALENP